MNTIFEPYSEVAGASGQEGESNALKLQVLDFKASKLEFEYYVCSIL